MKKYIVLMFFAHGNAIIAGSVICTKDEIHITENGFNLHLNPNTGQLQLTDPNAKIKQITINKAVYSITNSQNSTFITKTRYPYKSMFILSSIAVAGWGYAWYLGKNK